MAFTVYAGGRRPPHPDATHPRAWINDALTLPLEHIAATIGPSPIVDWSTAIPADQWGMDLNDRIGDCGIAQMDHWQMAEAARNERPWRSWGDDVCLQLTGHAIREEEGAELDRMRQARQLWTGGRRLPCGG